MKRLQADKRRDFTRIVIIGVALYATFGFLILAAVF